MRFGVLAFDDVFAEAFGPFGFDLGDDAAPQAAGLDEFGGHHPLRWFPGERGAGEDGELGVAGAEELRQWPAFLARGLLFDDVLDADVAEQSGQQGDVDVAGVAGLVVQMHADLLGDLP